MAGFRRRRFRRFKGRRRIRRRFRRFARVTKRIVRRMSEVKWSTFSGSQINNPNTIIIEEITPVTSLGTSKYSQRIGNKIRYKFLSIDMFFGLTYEGLSIPQSPGQFMCRVAVLSSRVSSLLNTDLVPTGTVWTTDNIWLPFDGTKVNVIKDWKFINTIIASNTAPGNYAPGNPAARRLKLRKRYVRNVTIREGALPSIPSEPQDRIFIVWGHVSTDNNNDSIVHINSRTSYIDI